MQKYNYVFVWKLVTQDCLSNKTYSDLNWNYINIGLQEMWSFTSMLFDFGR